MKNMQLRVIFFIVLALTVYGMVAAAGGPQRGPRAFTKPGRAGMIVWLSFMRLE